MSMPSSKRKRPSVPKSNNKATGQPHNNAAPYNPGPVKYDMGDPAYAERHQGCGALADEETGTSKQGQNSHT